jgi:hypothetical protein
MRVSTLIVVMLLSFSGVQLSAQQMRWKVNYPSQMNENFTKVPLDEELVVEVTLLDAMGHPLEIECQIARLSGLFDPGKPSELVFLRPVPQEKSLVISLRVGDYRKELANLNMVNYGTTFKSDTRFFIRLDGLRYMDADGNPIPLQDADYSTFTFILE